MGGDLWASQWSADYEQGIPVTPAPAAGQERSVDRVWFGDGQAVAVNLDIEPAEDMRWVDPTHPAG